MIEVKFRAETFTEIFQQIERFFKENGVSIKSDPPPHPDHTLLTAEKRPGRRKMSLERHLGTASKSEARHLLAQVEADERYGIAKVEEILNSFQIRTVSQLDDEGELIEFTGLCRRLLLESGGI